jgi:hypothetical protein
MTDRLPDPKQRDPTAAERPRRFLQRLKSRTIVTSSVEVLVRILEVILDACGISNQEMQDGRKLDQALGRLFRRDLVVIKK